MLCNVCQENDAKVHLTQIVGTKMHKVDLCEACAKEKGVQDPTTYELANVLAGINPELSEGDDSEKVNKCPTCGFTQKDFKKAGRFGCPECYDTFADGLETLLKSMHKGTRHTGKAPKNKRSPRPTMKKIETLQARLDKSIAAEKFEEAAILRDEIKLLLARREEKAV